MEQPVPFRTPDEYDALSVAGRDPGPQTLLTYINWLRRELATAEAALAAHPNQSAAPQSPREKKEPKS